MRVWLLDSIELIRLVREGDAGAREEVIVNNLALVWSIVKRFSNRGYDPDDLFQIGCIGLMKAIDRFDVSFAVKFSTYAVPMIIGEIKRFLRDDGIVKVSRSIKENGWKISNVVQQLRQEGGREPTISEIAEYTGISEENIIIAEEAGREGESIYAESYSERVSEQAEIDDEKDRLIDRILLDELLDSLAEQERELIKLRYFSDKTQTEVAKVLGISQVQVSRLEKKVLVKMRKKAVCE